MSVFDYIPSLKNMKEELKLEIYKLEKKKSELEKDISILEQEKIEKLEEQKHIQEDINKFKKDISKLAIEKFEIDDKLKRREKFYVEAELKYIDNLEGLAFEHYCSKLLQKLGYESIVTKASNDEGCDITARKDGISYAIQCKRYKGKVGNSAIQEIHAGKVCYDCQQAIAFTNSDFTQSAKQMANKLRVETWNREILIKMLYQAYNFELSHLDFKDSEEDGGIENEEIDPFLMDVIEAVVETRTSINIICATTF